VAKPAIEVKISGFINCGSIFLLYLFVLELST
jgi:hypothetical protein